MVARYIQRIDEKTLKLEQCNGAGKNHLLSGCEGRK